MKIKTTCGYILINRGPKILICHPTGADAQTWSIPKGIRDEGESFIAAAGRELSEETGLDIIEHKGELLGQYESFYNNKKKRLIAFPYLCETEIKAEDLKCGSYIERLGIYEIDEFKMVGLEEAYEKLHHTQVEVLKQVETQVKNFV